MIAIWGVAFTAGMVSTINPCGFAMLPAYLSYFLGLEGRDQGSKAPVIRALAVGAATSSGLFVVFMIAGLLLNAGAEIVRDVLPYVSIVIGLGLAALGVAMLRGFELKVSLPKAQGGTGSRRWRSQFVFGVSYSLASLSCTLPTFLIVVVGSLSGESFFTGIGTFFAYSMGMAIVLVSLTVSLGAAQTGLVKRLRTVMQHVNRISAVIMVVVFGSFVLEDDRIIQLFGFGLAIAVLLDATVVRLLLVPAAMELLGARNWWLPGWLDRALPRISIEHTPVPVPLPVELDDRID